MTKSKILIDLDVVTVGMWDKKGEKPKIAREFMKRIESKEFEVFTPYILIDLVSKWDNVPLREDIRKFYFENTSSFVERTDVITQIGKDFEGVFTKLKDKSISAKGLDYLVTFNRKHLKSKEKIINKVLAKYGLKTIKIVLPNEIQSSSSSTFDNLSK